MPEDQRGDGRKDGILLMRSGSALSVQGLAISAVEQGFSGPNRKVMADTLAGYVDEMTVIMPPAERRKLLTAINRAAPAFKAAWPAQYAAVSKALLDPACADICLVE
jgi:hypothetical protein